jgi:hypothetical protein
MVIAILMLILITGFSYSWLSKHAARERLNQLYTNGLQPIMNRDNSFYPQGLLADLDSVLNMRYQSPRGIMSAHYEQALAYLNLGDEKKAIALLDTIVIRTGAQPQDPLAKGARAHLALAYLRLGERNNCISGHCPGSCIFPIQGNGLYSDSSASLKSIGLYQDLLKDNPRDLGSRWLLNLAYMTLGDYPAKVPPEWLIPGLDTDTSSYKLKAFRDMAGDLGLNATKNMAGGSIVDDFNNDGYLDIVTSCWDLGGSMHYYRNNGNGNFTDVSKGSGLSEIKGGLNIIQADYNNDGYTDILVLRGAWMGEFGKQPNTLLRNNGDGTFTDVTVESGILSFHPTQTAVWADFNNDGWLDLFIGNETTSALYPHPSELYINNHDGTFTNVAHEAGCEEIGFTKGVTAADYNNDGWPDIFMSERDGHEILLKNKGVKGKIPQFENVTQAAGLGAITYTFPTWFFDYDNDGWPDIFASGYPKAGSMAVAAAADALNLPLGNTPTLYLYRNNHDGTFTDVSKKMGLDRPGFTMGSNFGDFDNDGWLDMYLGTGNPDFTSLVPNRMYRNIGGQKFADVTNSARVGNLQKGHGVAIADLDNDGDQDIFIETGGAFAGDAFYNSCFINPGQNDNNWISLLLEGVNSNRSAIGARIAVSFTEDGLKRTVYRDVNSGGSFGASPLRKEIGIGKAGMIDELIIKWPTSGIVQVFKNIKPCQFLRIREGSEQIEKMDLKTLKFTPSSGSMDMNMGMPPRPLNLKI